MSQRRDIVEGSGYPLFTVDEMLTMPACPADITDTEEWKAEHVPAMTDEEFADWIEHQGRKAFMKTYR